ncbi:MAG: amidohydrolase family protein [Acholeplasmataceae bacterium]|nr:amidohydrolase family protein [Acholeplasmataceae bacterium]
MYDKALINGKIYFKSGWQYQNIYIEGEKIALISDQLLPAKEIIDVLGYEVLPGVIDPHVHFELDLGFIKSVDDFYSGSVAAAYGGVTSYVDFLEPVDNVEDLEKAFYHRLSLAKKSVVDYHFHACIKNPKGDLEVFVKKMKALGMNTLKLFTTYSDSNRRTYDPEIIELLELSKKYHFLIMAHIENDDLITLDPKFTYRDLLKSRPQISETTEALKLAEYTRQTGGWMYMVHLSSGKTLEALIQNYPDILNQHFFIESCPQYFSFTNEVLNKHDGYLYTFAPPLRSAHEKDLLLYHQDAVYTIGTDHCAFMKKDKDQLTLAKTPLGIGGIEHALGVMRYHLKDQTIDKMTKRVAYTQSLRSKGEISEGFDADLVVFKPDNSMKVHGNHGTCDYSVYENHPSAGQVISTILRGQFVIKDGEFVGGKGQWIKGSDFH